MQLMPQTWADVRSALRLGDDPYDPHDNLLAGAAYLRAMYNRFGYPGLFAAYNAGPRRYADHLLRGRALPSETIAYLAKLAPASSAIPRTSLAESGTSFFRSSAELGHDMRRLSVRERGGLFAIRR